MTLTKSCAYFLFLTVAAACGGDDDATGSAGATAGETVVPTDPDSGEDISVVEAMNIALQGEFLAEETYRAVVDDLGPVEPFASIITAEVNHAEAFTTLYTARGLDVPASQWSRETVARYPGIREACEAGTQIEQATVDRYDAFLEADLPADVERVFTNLRDASRDRHLPAFERCDGTPPRQGR